MEKKQKIETVESKETVALTKEWAVENKILLIAVLGIAVLLVVVLKGNIPSIWSTSTVVTVNGNEITEQQVQEELAKVPAYYYSMMDNTTIRNTIIDQLVARELLTEKGNELGVSVTEQEIEAALANITEQAQLTQEEMMKRLEEENMTLDQVKALLKEQIAVNKVIETEALANVQVTQDEIKAYYDNATDSFVQVRASHILLCYEGALRCEQNRTEDEAYSQAEDLIAQLKDGAVFADVANEFSTDPSVESNSGDLGWFSKGQMVPEFENAVFTMNVGEISETPVKTDYGYHIIMVTDKKDSFEDFKDDIAQQLSLEKQKSAVESYLAALKAAAKIIYN